MAHEEYGQGFVDGFNAALKSDYLKEKFQTQDKEKYEKRIQELQTRMNQILLSVYQIMQYPLQSQMNMQTCSLRDYYQYGIENSLNAYGRTSK